MCRYVCIYIYHCTLIDTYSLKILWMHFPIHIYQLSFWGHGAVTNHLVNFRKHASREGKEADWDTTVLTTIHMFNQISQMKCNPCGGSNAITGLAETYCVFNHSINLSLDLSCRFFDAFCTRKPEICTNTKIISRSLVAECAAMMAPACRPGSNQQSTQQQPSSSSSSSLLMMVNDG